MSSRLTRMRWWHLPAVLELERVLFGEETWTEYHFWSELGQVDTRHYLVALEGPALTGYAGLCVYPDEGFVQTMAVAPAAQRTGLGARLLAALLEEADRRGRTTVSLEVRADNDVAQRLYARYGFRKAGVRRGYYGPSGTDAWVMTRTAASARGLPCPP